MKSARNPDSVRWVIFSLAVLGIAWAFLHVLRGREEAYPLWFRTKAMTQILEKVLNSSVADSAEVRRADPEGKELPVPISWPLPDDVLERLGVHDGYLTLRVQGASLTADAWGQPYYGVFDINKDGEVPNPRTDRDPSEPATLKARAVVFSAGPDGDPKTWKDNIGLPR